MRDERKCEIKVMCKCKNGDKRGAFVVVQSHMAERPDIVSHLKRQVLNALSECGATSVSFTAKCDGEESEFSKVDDAMDWAVGMLDYGGEGDQ